jgi:ubiquinone/menaquinone biosynthesis C-methylase UbiE
MNLNRAEQIITETQETYDAIAHHFSNTRFAAGSFLKTLTSLVRPKDHILDVGCGNGRLVEALPQKIQYTGVDTSKKLLEKARRLHPEYHDSFLWFDGKHLPVTVPHITHLFMLATFHHVPKPLQITLLSECHRVIQPGGSLTLTVWHLWRKPFSGYLLSSLPKKILSQSLDVFDIYVPWKNQKKEVLGKRFFHMFKKSELTSIAKKVGFTDIHVEIQSLAQQKNYVLTAIKK